MILVSAGPVCKVVFVKTKISKAFGFCYHKSGNKKLLKNGDGRPTYNEKGLQSLLRLLISSSIIFLPSGFTLNQGVVEFVSEEI